MRMYVSSVMYLVNCIQQPTKSISFYAIVAYKLKKSAVKNCCISVTGTKKMNPFKKIAERRFKTLRQIVQCVTTDYVLKK